MSRALRNFIPRFLSMPTAALVVAGASLIALASAYMAQYGFNLLPCVLCLWQRVPFGLAALVAIVAVVWRPRSLHSRVVMGLCALIFLSGTTLAVFHSGVERHWWQGTSGCSAEALHGGSPEDLREQLLKTNVVRCDHIAWSFLGFSMANLNVFYSFALTMFTAAAAWFGKKGKRR